MNLEEQKLNTESDLVGLKIAYVVANQDPKAQERILVRVTGVHNMANDSLQNSVWAHHCAPIRDMSGNLPEPGDWVWVIFPNTNDPMYIVWLGFVRSSFQITGTSPTPVETPPALDGLGNPILEL